MARTVNPEEYARKRGEIIDSVQRLIASKGYERMTMQDVLADLGISSGALYHYFDSKPALLQGCIDRIRETTEASMLPLIHDPKLSAIEKLNGFFNTLDQLRVARLEDVVRLSRVWYSDENAIVRQKVADAVAEQRAPMLAEVVRQGIAEGVMNAAHPEQAGEVIMALIRGMNERVSRLLLTVMDSPEPDAIIETIVATIAAYMDALERFLGAPPASLTRADAESVRDWIALAKLEHVSP